MDGRVRHAADAFNQIGDAPRRPQARAISQGLGATHESLFNPPDIGRRELRRPSGARRALQRLPPARGELPRPAVHRLAMHADPTRDIGFADIVLEQARRLQASPLQLHAIDRDTGWMSHASDYTRFSAVCHYVL